MTFNRAVLTAICFVFFVAIVVPGCALSALYVAASTRIWLAVLTKRHPQLEFIGRLSDIRSHVDTNRNHGVHHVLLELQGPCDVEVIREALLTGVLARNEVQEEGEYVFPRLRQCLAKHYGFYALHKINKSFNIENHVVITSNPIVRGRIVTKSNIQEYVTQAASKYLSIEQPPWHIELISTESEGNGDEVISHYALVRIHHMLLAEYPHQLNLRKFLQLDTTGDELISSSSPSNQTELHKALSSLFIYKQPTSSHINRLISQFFNVSTSSWAKFIEEYETKHPSSGITAFTAQTVIFFVQTVQQYLIPSKTFLNKSFANELNVATAADALRQSMHLRQLTEFGVSLFKTLIRIVCIHLPYFVYSECLGVLRYFNSNLRNTDRTSFIVHFGLEMARVFLELWEMSKLMVTGPLCIMEILFRRSVFQRNAVHSVSIQGRKSLAWSSKVEVGSTNEPRLKSLDGIGEAVRNLLEKLKKEPKDADVVVRDSFEDPKTIAVAIREVPWEYILENKRQSQNTSQFVCINLPAKSGGTLQEFQEQNANIITNQAASIWIQHHVNILSYILPSPAIHVLLNFISKRFPILVTHIEGDLRPRRVWNIPVVDSVYFGTTQCNTGLFITHVGIDGLSRISVKSDTHFNTHLPRIVDTWMEHMNT